MLAPLTARPGSSRVGGVICGSPIETVLGTARRFHIGDIRAVHGRVGVRYVDGLLRRQRNAADLGMTLMGWQSGAGGMVDGGKQE
jgi:hypothetical protein